MAKKGKLLRELQAEYDDLVDRFGDEVWKHVEREREGIENRFKVQMAATLEARDEHYRRMHQRYQRMLDTGGPFGLANIGIEASDYGIGH